MASGQQLTLDRMARLIPPAPPTSGLPLARLIAASYFLGDWQDAQATAFEQQLSVGAACNQQPVSPSLLPMSNPAYVAPSQDPRFALWTGYYINPPIPYDPTPTLVVPPASQTPPTGSSTASGASGGYLDDWGSALGNSRWGYQDLTQTPPVWVMETDSQYALRILADISRPSTTSYGLALVINAAFGLPQGLSVNVVDAAAQTGGHRFLNSTFGPANPALASIIGNKNFTPAKAANTPGFTAGDDSLAGCFYVQIPLVRNADQSIGSKHITPALVNALVNRRKAAGTQCRGLFALGEYTQT